MSNHYACLDVCMTVCVDIPDGEDPKEYLTSGDSLIAFFQGVDECLTTDDYEVMGVRIDGTEVKL